MKTRILTALVALPILIVSIVLPEAVPDVPYTRWLFVLLAAAAFIAALFEYFTLTKKLELKADAGVGYLCAAAIFTSFLFDAPAKAPELLLFTLAVCLLIVLITQTYRFRKDFTKILSGVGVTLLGALYVSFLGGFVVSLRMGFEQQPGLSTDLLSFFFLVAMGSDVGAYFIGKRLGKHKMAPAISPNKTWEGFAGGLLLAVGFAALSTFWFFPGLPYAVSIPLGLVMGLLGVAGDLVESAFKRASGTKDAAEILPGHGGLLDRLDSLIFNAPLLYFFARFYF